MSLESTTTKLCEYCGNEITSRHAERYCSPECSNLAKKINQATENHELKFTSHHERLMKYPALRRVWRETLGTNSRLHRVIDQFLYEQLYKEMK